MEKPHYPFESFGEREYYYFESKGESPIIKVIAYIPVNLKDNVVELVFGDLTNDNQIDTLSKNSNNDMPLIITTVIFTIFDYLDNFPEKIVYFRGSSPSRTRLYRAAIAKTYSQIELLYEIYGRY